MIDQILKMRSSMAAVLILVLSTLAARADEVSRIGTKVADFSLIDFRGNAWALSDAKERKLVVLAFLGVDCPMARSYGPQLAKLAMRYESKGVTFVGLDPNSQDSISQMAAYAKVSEIKFPFLKDLNNQIADRLAVTRTPEVLVLDAERIVRYAGRIDDQFAVGVMRDAPMRQDLVAALDDLLAGIPVRVPSTEAPGCLIGRVREPKNESDVTYSNQIARIFENHCIECHRPGQIAPFSLTKYRDAAGWADMIQEVVGEGRMPPWHADPKHGRFANERRLSLDEKRLIRAWVAAGAPEGDPKQLPQPKSDVEGRQLSKPPDQIIAMSVKPYDVPSEGAVQYQYFTVASGFKEDRWITAAEVMPGNRAVVHHVLVFAQRPDERSLPGEGGLFGFLAAYVPGLRTLPYPTGIAKRIPAGAQIVFQVHYTPVGSKQLDNSKLALTFADPHTIKYEVCTCSAVQRRLHIPPGEPNYQARATSVATPAGAILIGMMPHMHLRGQAFTYEAIFPDYKRETLLAVPHYDFNWQTSYRLAEVRPLPAGTRIHASARFDNSADNPHNPDPTSNVQWGDQTWDEMMIGYFDLAIPRDPKNPHAVYDLEQMAKAEMIARGLDKNDDGTIDREELPARKRVFFDQLDSENKGRLTIDEAAAALRKKAAR